jgi:hypothetical protein
MAIVVLRNLSSLVAALFFVIAFKISAGAPTEFLHASEPKDSEPKDVIPANLGDHVFVAAGEQIRYTFHVFDLEFYVANASSLWGRNLTADELIESAPGEATLRYDIVSPLVTKERIGQAVEDKVKSLVSSDEWKSIDGVFVERLQQGPFKGVGAVIEMRLGKDGVRISMDGKDMGYVASVALPVALLSIYFDEQASNQDFVKATLENLATGLPDSNDPINVVRDSKASFLRNVIVGCGSLLGAGCLLGCICCCRRCFSCRIESCLLAHM